MIPFADRIRISLVFAFFAIACPVAESQSIRIATLEYPPYIQQDEGGVVGGPVARRVIEAFEVLGIRPLITVYPISRGLIMVETGEVDAYFTLKKTPKREETLLFVETPLLRQAFVFFVRVDTATSWDGTFDSISKSRIGVVRSTSYGPVFDRAVSDRSIMSLDEAQSFELNFRKLLAGRVDLVINSYDVGYAILRAIHAENAITDVAPPVEVVSSYFAFTRAKDHSQIAKMLNEVLRESVRE